MSIIFRYELYNHFSKLSNNLLTFCKRIKLNGLNVLGIGDQPFESLNDELKANLTEYCYFQDMNNIDWMIKKCRFIRKKY